MASEETLKDGTWIRCKVPLSDSGDFGDREAKAGSLATVSLVDGSGASASYSVVAWPSFITTFWDAGEIAADAEVLPEGHPDIPSAHEHDFASAVADVAYEGDVDDDEGVVTAPASVVDRILAGSREGRYAGNPDVARLLGDGGREVELSFADFNRLAEFAGVGDRLQDSSAPTP